jgi:VWA domain-containing protein
MSASGFSVQVDQNVYLSEGATSVDAVVTVTATGTPAPVPPDGLEVLVLDCSGSMSGEKIRAARYAATVAVAQLRDGVRFAVIKGTGKATRVYPPDTRTAVADERTRAEATAAVNWLEAGGTTGMGGWLRAVGELAEAYPAAVRHAILLTDGISTDSAREFDSALADVRGKFGCDCRGVGTDWRVDELRRIAETLLGTVDIVADPDDLATDFGSIMAASMAKSTADVALRLWSPSGAQVRLVKQVAPEVLDLTARRTDIDARRGEYPLGAWGAESRDYHIGVEVVPAEAGDEMLAGRVQLVRRTAGGEDEVLAQGLIKAIWTDDESLSSRISHGVAHYTGQAELAAAIQDGLAARKAGDEATATARLGRAVALAHESGNEQTARLLANVVDVLDAPSGTIRLRPSVSDVDEMTLDTRSTRTARFRAGSGPDSQSGDSQSGDSQGGDSQGGESQGGES